MDYQRFSHGITKKGTDDGLITSGSIVFMAGEDLTIEKKTSAISLLTTEIHPDGIFLLAIEKPTENTAGNLTVNTYNQIKVNGTDERDVFHTTHTVEKITDMATYRNFLIQGLFIGEGKIKLGMKFATDSGAITCYWKLFRL